MFDMGLSYEQAVSALYQAAFESFVSERKRLVAALKAEGDKAAAARLAKSARPSISAWAVNQLWWHARDAFDEMFETAAELRKGKLAANPAHRKALAKLGARAQQLLMQGGHSANDATLRRVTMTLSGLAAAGSFEPDSPGALTKDRDPPGFEAFGIASSSAREVVGEEPSLTKGPEPAADEGRHSEEAAEHEREAQAQAAEHKREAQARAERQREAEARAAEHKREAQLQAAERRREAEAQAAEHKREAEAQAKRQARRKQLAGALASAKTELTERERERDRIQKQLATAEREVERARAVVDAAQAALDVV